MPVAAVRGVEPVRWSQGAAQARTHHVALLERRSSHDERCGSSIILVFGGRPELGSQVKLEATGKVSFLEARHIE